MNVIVKGSFYRDVTRVRSKALLASLDNKISQIERAEDILHITGLKLLRSYTNHYRIVVKSAKDSYRIGAIIRGNKIWWFVSCPENPLINISHKKLR
ncbi:MAG: hypothetical protein C4308_09155 [Chitinophagaceae bacterium]